MRYRYPCPGFAVVSTKDRTPGAKSMAESTSFASFRGVHTADSSSPTFGPHAKVQ